MTYAAKVRRWELYDADETESQGIRKPSNSAGNALDSIIMPLQIRTISTKRVLNARLGVLTDIKLQREIEDKVLQHLGIAFDVPEVNE